MIKANASLILDFNFKWLDSKREWASLGKDGCGDFSVLLGKEMLRTDQSEIVIGHTHMCDAQRQNLHLTRWASHAFLLDSYMQTLTIPFSLILADIRKIHALLFSREQSLHSLYTIAYASQGKRFTQLHKDPLGKGLEIAKHIHKGVRLCFHPGIRSCSTIFCNATP